MLYLTRFHVFYKLSRRLKNLQSNRAACTDLLPRTVQSLKSKLGKQPDSGCFLFRFLPRQGGRLSPLPARIFQILKAVFSLTWKCEYDTLKVEIDYIGRGVSTENGRIIP